MVLFEEFEEMINEIATELPEEFFYELSGGIIVRENRKLHPMSHDEDLVILGEYCRNHHLGRFVVVYYGSFMQLYEQKESCVLKKLLKKTVLHEFRHHLESLAGEKDLEFEDQEKLRKYLRKVP